MQWCFVNTERIKTYLKHIFLGFIVVSALAWMFHDSINQRIQTAKDPYCFADDVKQQIVPLMRYQDPQLFPKDYVVNYFAACVPWAFKMLYKLYSYFDDPVNLSKSLPLVFYFLTALGLGILAWRFGGWVPAWAATSFVLSSDIYMNCMAGGMPQAFAYPILVWGLIAIELGKINLLMIMTIIGAAFYPPSAIPLGLSLFLILFLLPAHKRGQSAPWPILKRVYKLLLAALLCLAFVIPSLIALKPYKPTISYLDMNQYPELEPKGCYDGTELPPFHGFLEGILIYAPLTFMSSGQSWIDTTHHWTFQNPNNSIALRKIILIEIFLLVAVLGFGKLMTFSFSAQRIFIFLIAVWLSHIAARLLAPLLYLPEQYEVYPIPILLTLTLAVGSRYFATLFGRIGHSKLVQIASTFLICSICLITLTGRGNKVNGQYPEIITNYHSLYDFIGQLPKDVMIAGWPTGPVNNIPYLCKRSAYITFESHPIFHEKYALEMRKRMKHLIRAYFAIDLKQILKLRDKFKITHLIINTKHFKKCPKYFHPYEKWIKEAYKQGPSQGFKILDLIPTCTVYQEESCIILDLRKIPTSLIDQ